jgi:hypothetical protein
MKKSFTTKGTKVHEGRSKSFNHEGHEGSAKEREGLESSGGFFMGS